MRTLIIGCGYLGARVAKLWVDQGKIVSAITRSDANAQIMQSDGIIPIVADITDPNTLDAIQQPFDVVLFAVGFDRSRYDDIRMVYVEGLKNVLGQLSEQTKQFIYISSTGVYGNSDGGWVTEQTPASPVRPGAKACLEAESLITSSKFGDRSTILRLAGIYGPQRVPRVVAVENREWSSLSRNGHINLIHVDDGASIVDQVVQQQILGETLLVSDGKPPNRKDFFEFIADLKGTGPIDWDVATSTTVESRAAVDKRIDNRRLIERTGYKFQYPNFEAGIRQSIGS